MSDSVIAQPTLKHDVPKIDFSHVIGQTWQMPQDKTNLVNPASKSEPTGGYLDLGNWKDLYGEGKLIAQAAKINEAGDNLKHDAKHHPGHSELSVENHGASAKYAKEVQHGLDHLPPQVKAELAKHHLKIYVFKNAEEYYKAFPQEKDQGIDEAAHSHQRDPKNLRIVVFENTRDGSSVESHSYDPAGLLKHEIGHAHNFLNGNKPLADMRQSLKTELNEMMTHDPAKYNDMINAFHNGTINKYHNSQEMYAELYAIATGTASDDVAKGPLAKFFPKTIQHMKDELKKGH